MEEESKSVEEKKVEKSSWVDFVAYIHFDNDEG